MPSIIPVRRNVLHRSSAAGSGTSLTFTATDVSQVFQTGSGTLTWTGVNIGTASSDRIVVVAVSGEGNAGTSISVTIGGVTATRAIGINLLRNMGGTEIWYLPITSGTTATIVVTADGGATFMSEAGIAVGKITGSATATVSAVNTADTWASAVADPHSISAAVPANGVGIISAVIDRNVTATWSGATGDATINQVGGNARALLMAHGISSAPSFTGANNFSTVLTMVTFGP